jgi:hypothetical protein
VDPPAPTLEHLWEGQVDIEVRGPTGRKISCVLSLFEGMATDPTVLETLPPMPLPLLRAEWRAHFERHVRASKKAQGAYDSARKCRLDFSAEELGSFSLECEREFVPLRWALRQRGRNVIARLIDDSGAPESPEIALLSFDTPTKAVQLSPSPEFPVEAPGGLFTARRGGVTAALLAVPGTIRNMADLGASPQMEVGARSVDEVLRLLECAQIWHSARSSGDILSSTKRRTVLRAFACHILCLLAGDQWARAESALRNSTGSDLTAMKLAVSNRRDQMGLAAALALEIDNLATAEYTARVSRFAELALSFRILAPGASDNGCENPAWLAELSLRVASSPGLAASWAGPHLRSAIRKLLEEVPVLARASRFLVVATDRHLQSRTAPGELYAGWGWA